MAITRKRASYPVGGSTGRAKTPRIVSGGIKPPVSGRVSGSMGSGTKPTLRRVGSAPAIKPGFKPGQKPSLVAKKKY